MNMKKFFPLLALTILLAACDKPQASAPAAEMDLETASVQAAAEPAEQDIVVAKVGPEQITRRQLDQRLEVLDKDDQDFAATPMGRRSFIQVLVREKLAELDAKAKGLDKSDVYLSDLEDKRAELKELYQQYAQQVLDHMWEDYNYESGLLAVTDEEIAAYHKKYPYEMTIKQIIIDDPQTAEVVLRALKNNKNRWKELERQYSVAPERSRGKSLSFIPGEFIPELEVIAANSSTGSVQGFVKTSQGFHIIMKTNERRLSLKDASDRVRTILENQKLDNVFNALQNKYEVIIYD